MQLNFRCTDEEKAAWEAQSGGNISGWLKDLANAEVARNGGSVAKVSQKRPGRPKKPLPQAVNTAAAVAEKLQTIKRQKVPAPTAVHFTPPVTEGQQIHETEFCSHAPIKIPSALPKPFLSVLDRVKSPAQLKHDPAATQFKPAKAKKGNS